MRTGLDTTRRKSSRRRKSGAGRRSAKGAPRPFSTTPKAAERLWQLSADLMAVVDAQGVLRAVNNAWSGLLGWRAEELTGHPFEGLVHPDDWETTRAHIFPRPNGAHADRFENRLRDREGRYHTISWRTAPARGLQYAVGRDITQRLEREAALRQAQKMEAVGQLTGGIAHDFNNLLTIMRSSIDMLQHSDLPQERRDKYQRAISEAVDRAAKITSQLLTFARKQTADCEVFDVTEKIANVSELLRELVGPGVAIQTSDAPSACSVEADLCQFETALMNLVANARDAMDRQGTLFIAADVVSDPKVLPGDPPLRGDFVAVSVHDHGRGVSADHMGRIFEPFFTTKALGEGTGLGLSQVYGFAHASGGGVHVQSRLGAGATFTVYLPLRQSC